MSLFLSLNFSHILYYYMVFCRCGGTEKGNGNGKHSQ